jgi:hypothetical protein
MSALVLAHAAIAPTLASESADSWASTAAASSCDLRLVWQAKEPPASLPCLSCMTRRPMAPALAIATRLVASVARVSNRRVTCS